jgi:glycine dehydrogenase subunit 2
MKLIFEKSREGRGCSLLPACDVPVYQLDGASLRKNAPRLPEVAEIDLIRHYSALAKRAHGVNDGFYPLGSCTMKYNPKINEEIAALPGFTRIHPLQPLSMSQGCMEVLKLAETYLCEITGMDQMTLQPAAGAHGEFTGMLLIKAFHQARKDTKRTKIIVPDAAHGTNPASAVMAGFEVISIPSNEEGMVDVAKLREVAGDDTAGLMLTNPNTVGLFDKNILEITEIIHKAGGLNYYDGANLNAIMGKVRPGDMGFDVIHINLHKTFATPHGGGGPGSGPVGCKAHLAVFMPGAPIQDAAAWAGADDQEMEIIEKAAEQQAEELAAKQGAEEKEMEKEAKDILKRLKEISGAEWEFGPVPALSIGSVRAFYGNFLVVVKALAYILTLGKEGIPEASENAVLNANYLMSKVKDLYPVAYGKHCMHEFVLTLEELKKETGVAAMDVAKGLLDFGIHPPTMYFPLIVHEALMLEPTETESRETMDEAAEMLRKLYEIAKSDPDQLHAAPVKTPVQRLDEVGAARHPKLHYDFPQ